MKITRQWAMPSMHTFTIKPIHELVTRYVGDGKGWIDPFAGENSPAEITNDLNPAKPAKYHMHALDFAKMLDRFYDYPDAQLCAHNGKEFDFPYIARRMIINGIRIPRILQVAGKKPWETQFIDTMELWKFGDYKNYTSLDLLCAVLEIPTPKDDINGSEVGRVYWQENDLERIKTYCQKDVLAIAQLMRRYNYLPLITEDCVDYTN